MAGLLEQYAVLQQNTWNGRKIYSAQERRTGQVVHLVAEAARGRLEGYGHPSLPPVSQVQVEDGIRWLVGSVPDGDSLEDLRARGALTPTDVLTMLLTVVDGLASLARLDPPLVPGYLDPVCIRRDPFGRWTLDYLALAHAPEARASGGAPLGVYPMGALLYWLVTGLITRRTKIQAAKLDDSVPAHLQFVIIRCLGRAYPSLAELRTDLERAGNEQDFRQVLSHMAPVAKPQESFAVRRSAGGLVPPGTPHLGIPPAPSRPANAWQPEDPAGAPAMPLEHRRLPQASAPGADWALPRRPDAGFRSFVVPPPPDPVAARQKHYALIIAGAVVLALVVGMSASRVFVAPPQSAYPGMARSSARAGAELPPEPDKLPRLPGPSVDDPLWDPAFRPPAQSQPVPDVSPDPAKPEQPKPAPAQPDQAVAEPVKPEPANPEQVKPEPAKPEPVTPEPANPDPGRPGQAVVREAPQPEPGSVEFFDKQLGGKAMLVFTDGHEAGWAYIWVMPRSPWISLGAFNKLTGKNLYWTRAAGDALRIYDGTGRNFITYDYDLVGERLWLKMTLALQRDLSIRVNDTEPATLHIDTR